MNRKEFLEELKLRQYIKNIIFEYKKNKSKETLIIRSYIKKLIKEASSSMDQNVDTPSQSTGLNILRDLLKKIVPIIEGDYKSLSTSYEQRESFREHMLNAVQITLLFGKTTDDIENELNNDEEKKELNVKIKKEQPIEESEGEGVTEIGKDAEVGVTEIGEGTSDSLVPTQNEIDKMIDISKKEKPRISRKEKYFTLPGHEITGRNMALRTYDKIEKNIVDSNAILADDKDKEVFYDYLITNLKLYFKLFEQELAPSLSEPTTDEFEEIEDQEQKVERPPGMK